MLSNELRNQQEGKATRWAAFFDFQRAVAPCLNGCLFPTALISSCLNCRSLGGAEICLVSKRMFIPDGTPVLVTKYYILTRRNIQALNIAVCSATSVESCLCLKAPREFPKAETILVIRGVSALDKELLGTLVAEAREALETLEKQLVQAQEEYEEATKTAKRSNYICNELFTWADVYDTANHDERRAILQQFIKEIRVRKDYEISITLNASFNQVEQLKSVSIYDGAEIFEEISEKGA